MYYYNRKTSLKFIYIKYAYVLKTYNYFHRNIDIICFMLTSIIYKYKEKL